MPLIQMETFGVFDGGEQAATTQRGQFVQTSANRSAVVATQPRGPRPASQNHKTLFFVGCWKALQ